jgi:branched-chain amino acid transport system permease protein
MDIFLSAVIVGVITGTVYAAAGAGLVVIYRTSGYVSFAQGDIAAVSLYVGLWAHDSGWSYGLVAVVVILAGALIGGLLGTVLVVPIERFGHLSAALATVAVALMLQGGMDATVGSDIKAFPQLGGGETLFDLGPVGIKASDILAVAACVGLFVVLGLAFSKLRIGIASRAINDSPAAGEILGIPANRLRRLSWMIAGGMSAMAGLFVAPTYGLTPTSVNVLLVYAFCAAAVGGFESIFGALVAGVGLGIASNLVAAYVDSTLVTTAVFALLLVVLLFRPHGLFGRRPLARV